MAQNTAEAVAEAEAHRHTLSSENCALYGELIQARLNPRHVEARTTAPAQARSLIGEANRQRKRVLMLTHLNDVVLLHVWKTLGCLDAGSEARALKAVHADLADALASAQPGAHAERDEKLASFRKSDAQFDAHDRALSRINDLVFLGVMDEDEALQLPSRLAASMGPAAIFPPEPGDGASASQAAPAPGAALLHTIAELPVEILPLLDQVGRGSASKTRPAAAWEKALPGALLAEIHGDTTAEQRLALDLAHQLVNASRVAEIAQPTQTEDRSARTAQQLDRLAERLMEVFADHQAGAPNPLSWQARRQHVVSSMQGLSVGIQRDRLDETARQRFDSFQHYARAQANLHAMRVLNVRAPDAVQLEAARLDRLLSQALQPEPDSLATKTLTSHDEHIVREVAKAGDRNANLGFDLRQRRNDYLGVPRPATIAAAVVATSSAAGAPQS